MTGDRLRGFPPVWRHDARVLVLGSMPSTTSLREARYYGHPRNAFWRIAGALFGAGPELDYGRRLEVLMEAGVALWDVCGACTRTASADASIRDVEENDVADLVERSPDLRAIACNGTTAHALFRRRILSRHAPRLAHVRVLRLPSTSPAHAARSEAEKLEAWRVLLDLLHREP